MVPVPSGEIDEAGPLRLRARFERGRHVIGLEALVGKRGDELWVVGMAPEGTRLFTLRQRGQRVAVEISPGAVARFPTPGPGKRAGVALLGDWVLDALHRGRWIAAAPGSAPQRAATWTREGEDVVETRREGRRRREFRRSGSSEVDAPVVVLYRGRDSPGAAGFEIRNDWCGYRAVLVPWTETVAR